MRAAPPSSAASPASRRALFQAVFADRGVNGVDPTDCPEGLGLRAAQAFDEGQVILSCPPERISSLCGGYGDVEKLCDELPFNSFMGPAFYWAALCSLTQAQAGSAWPRLLEAGAGLEGTICDETQRLLLALHAPTSLSWRAPGITTSPESGVPTDLAVVALVERWGLLPDTASLLQQLALAWKYNSFSVGGGDGRTGIYFAAAACNHSCAPAACYTLEEPCSAGTGPHLVIRALRPLSAGDAVTISYIEGTVPQAPSRSVAVQRRRKLASFWLFYCRCSACSPVGTPPEACTACPATLSIWISDRDSGPYGPTEGPVCDGCGREDLVVAGPYFLHCPVCEMDWCPECAASLPEASRQWASEAP